MAVRAGRPSSGSGGLEAYAIPIFALIVMAWLVRRLGPLLAARISRLLVGEETPLDFANKGKLKGKKRVTKATPASALLRSPTKKSAGSPSVGAASSAAQEEVAPVAASKATGPASYQESAVAPLAAVNDQEAQATAKARNDSVEWTVNESKKRTRLSEGASAAGPRATGCGLRPTLPRPREAVLGCWLAGRCTALRRAPLPEARPARPLPSLASPESLPLPSVRLLRHAGPRGEAPS